MLESYAVALSLAIDRLSRSPLKIRRFVGEARAKVWRNTLALNRARRAGPDRYAAVLADLEQRCAARVHDLTRPGLVLVTLAVRGFGVVVAGAPPR